MPSGLIFGRSPNLWLGAAVAIISALGTVLKVDPGTIVLLDGVAGAVIALVAGNDRIQIASGNAAQDRQQ